jgi:hypothetical protein
VGFDDNDLLDTLFFRTCAEYTCKIVPGYYASSKPPAWNI